MLCICFVIGGCGASLKTTVHQETPAALNPGQIRVATCQFPVSNDISENAAWIRKQMNEAAGKHADIVHFPETALSGYARKDIENMDQLDYDLQRQELASILALAKELKLWVVLGATHPLSGSHKPHNSLYIINCHGDMVDRYDKRFCTSGDLKSYSPGDHFAVFDVNGVTCGALICYDVRFPELYREYVKQDVRMMFHSFYNARMKPTAVHHTIMPATLQTRAATNYIFVSANNSSVPSAWTSLFITPDGLIQKQLPRHQPAVMVNLVDIHKKYYDGSGRHRNECIDGKLNSGETVSDDPRSRDRQIY